MPRLSPARERPLRADRIFHPIAQGRRWDPDGEYVRRWVPELRAIELERYCMARGAAR